MKFEFRLYESFKCRFNLMTGHSRIEQIMIIQENAFKQKKENLKTQLWDSATWPGNWNL